MTVTKLEAGAEMRVPSGVAEIVGALEQKRFGDPFDGRHSNT